MPRPKFSTPFIREQISTICKRRWTQPRSRSAAPEGTREERVVWYDGAVELAKAFNLSSSTNICISDVINSAMYRSHTFRTSCSLAGSRMQQSKKGQISTGLVCVSRQGVFFGERMMWVMGIYETFHTLVPFHRHPLGLATRTQARVLRAQSSESSPHE